ATTRIYTLSLHDALPISVTGYDELDQRIARTKADKTYLLMVLDHPEVPLHNNPAELDARTRVRKRVVSYGPRSLAGARTWDAMRSEEHTSELQSQSNLVC